MRDVVLRTRSAEETRRLGEKLGRALLAIRHRQPVVVALNGDLGAGKTTFVGGLLAAMGVAGAVRSPTYTLVEPYALGDTMVYHMDLYRLAGAGELDSLALRDLLHADAVLLIEWAERASTGLPPLDLAIHLSYDDAVTPDERTVTLKVGTAAGESLCGSLVAADS